VAALPAAFAAEIERAADHSVETRAMVGGELARLLGRRLPDELLAQAWSYVDFTKDPLVDALDAIADDAYSLGLAPKSSHATLMG
jgi:hypothetical protein